ncbi:hypothetical protein, partial [Mycobacterium tuberculosis]
RAELISGGNHEKSKIIATPNQPAASTAPPTTLQTQTSPRADGKTIHTENPHFYQNFIHEFGMSRSRRHVTAASHRARV